MDVFWLVARRKELLKEIADEHPDKTIAAISLDLSQEESLEIFEKLLKENEPEIKVLVNNAGFGKCGDFFTSNRASQMGMVDVNCRALTAITRLCLPYMLDDSLVINVASIAAFAPTPRMSVYSATKAYVLALSKALHDELRPRGIKVLAVCPGPMDTDFWNVAGVPGGQVPADRQAAPGGPPGGGGEVPAGGQAGQDGVRQKRGVQVLPRAFQGTAPRAADGIYRGVKFREAGRALLPCLLGGVCMDSLRQAQSYLERDPLRYMDMLEPIRRGMVEVTALREDGVLLYNLPGELYMLAADSVESAQALCAGVGEMELGRGPQPGDRGVSAKAVWHRRCPGLHPGGLPGEGALSGGPGCGDTPLGPGGLLRGLCELPLLLRPQVHPGAAGRRVMRGAFAQGQLLGFIGMHSEGSVGMLEVLPPYRRRGVALALMSAMANHCLERGWVPFSQIFDGNTASLELHRRLGWTLCPEKLYWVMD